MTTYYNEIDPYAAAWLRNLIAAGHIAPGDVDERSIEDVRPDDLRGYTQCHFFAGIGVWSYALRLAGWPDDAPVWTGSCPCQPFSAAGKGVGFADERHLWPAFHWLIKQCRPPVLFGEQVASKIVDDWLDVVSSDLEGLGFAVGAIAFPSAGVGAPHIRDRTYFVAHTDNARSQGRRGMRERATERAARESGVAVIVADAMRAGSLPGAIAGIHRSEEGAGPRHGELERLGDARGLAGADRYRRPPRGLSVRPRAEGQTAPVESGGSSSIGPGPTNGFWRDADWLLCRDEKWRPVRPGSQPLVDGAPSRVGRLRAYGNAINAQAAAEFIRVSMECLP